MSCQMTPSPPGPVSIVAAPPKTALPLFGAGSKPKRCDEASVAACRAGKARRDYFQRDQGVRQSDRGRHPISRPTLDACSSERRPDDRALMQSWIRHGLERELWPTNEDVEPMSGEMQPNDPSDEEVRQYVSGLIGEVDEELRSDRWVILVASVSGLVRLYAGALLWHCCELLRDIHDAIASEREMAMRILHRAFHEAWLMGLYVQYSGIEATMALESDMKASFQAQANEAALYDQVLATERQSAAQVRERNQQIEAWNRDHPNLVPRDLLPEIPEPSRVAINLAAPALERFADVEAKRLSLPDIISRLNTSAKSIGEGEEHFGIVYTMGYRTLSSIGPHPNLEVIQAYFDSTLPNNFVRLERQLRTPSAADLTRHVTLQCAAHLSERVLGPVEGANLSVTRQILSRYLSEGSSIPTE